MDKDGNSSELDASKGERNDQIQDQDIRKPRYTSDNRTIYCCDAIEWLNSVEDNSLPEGYCGFTSLPDITELIHTFKTETAEYKKWFTNAVALFMSKLSVGSYVVFLQSDVRYLSTTGEISEWIDKSYLCSAAAERTGCVLMWHKLVRVFNISCYDDYVLLAIIHQVLPHNSYTCTGIHR